MNLTIFDVQHGACALVTCDNGDRIMIDCGHSGPNDWRPGNYLVERGIHRLQLLIITNYDEDHVSGLPNLREKVKIDYLLRNKSVTPETLTDLKRENGIGSGMTELVSMAKKYTGAYDASTAPTYPRVKRTVFQHTYPKFEDENNLSLVVNLEIAGINFMFPGDLEKAGWKSLLETNADFREAVRKVHFLMASHHGRENGKYEPLFTEYGCKPYLVLISDKQYEHESQETVPFYAGHVKGFRAGDRDRHVLTTRNDGCIRFSFGEKDRTCTISINFDMNQA